MSPQSEDGSILGESAYEFIDTDTESRDDNRTESIASTDFGRPDDVASIADTEQSESGDEEESAPIPAYSGLDHPADESFDTPIARSSAIVNEDCSRPLVDSIEFEEPFSLGAENVSVKHTITDFSEEHTAKIVKNLMLHTPPQRLVGTIRQTMTKQGLSTRDPLRILYVGSHSAKQDIIHKIASSVTASVEGGKRAQHLRHSASQLYNVVPVSAFGSERTPEIELMHSSGYQIKVEDCIFAQTLKFEDAPEKPDVIKLTLEDNYCYHSVPDQETFIIEPHWELPQIAIFYCSDSDDIDARKTRAIARQFMSRHSIPSVVISHQQLFDQRQGMSLDQHAIHMCLESRDINGRGNVIHQRLPIDLASFLNIDARQMNRNLAYLTGLHEPLELPQPVAMPTKVETNSAPAPEDEKTSISFLERVNNFRNQTGPVWGAVLPVSMLLLSVITALLTGFPSYSSSSNPAISINSKIVSNIPISSTPSPLSSISILSSISTSTSITVATSTRTITVTESRPTGPNSLAVVPSMEIGKTSQKFTASQQVLNKSVCSAEILGDREILIRIPSATKLSWLTKEAMSVNITRDNDTVDTERAYSSDEGIVLLLSKKDAYGVLNISIVTKRRPRVNETFQVDFGTSAFQSWQNLVDKVSAAFSEEFSRVDPAMSDVRLKAEKIVEDAKSQSQSTLNRLQEVRKAAVDQASSATESITSLAKAMSMEVAKRSAILSKELGIRLTEAESKLAENIAELNSIQEPLNEGIFKAQVRSKLVWLRMQGKEEEYKAYEKAALEASRSRTEELKKSKQGASKKSRRCSQKDKKLDKKKWADRLAKKSAKKEARAAKKLGRKQKV